MSAGEMVLKMVTIEFQIKAGITKRKQNRFRIHAFTGKRYMHLLVLRVKVHIIFFLHLLCFKGLSDLLMSAKVGVQHVQM